jgi:hypothetical protein
LLSRTRVAALDWWKLPVSRKILDAVYIVGSFAGSMLIASNTGLNWWGYVFFLAAAISGTWLLIKSNASGSLLLVNVGYAIINSIGLVRYW